MSKQHKNIEMKRLVPKLRFPEFRDAGEWKIKPMEKLFTIGNGKDHKHLPDGDIPVYGSGGYMRSVNEYLYEGESACIGRKGTIDKPVFLSGKFWTVDTLFYTHSFKDCLPKFIYLIFQNVNWRSHNEAGGVPSLSKANINKIEVACPKLTEQQKISDCLSSIDELITAHTQKHEALKAHKKGLMQQLFPAEGETVPKLRFPEFQGAEEWEEQKIESLAKRGSGHTPNKKESSYYNGEIKWVSLADSKRLDSGYIYKTKIEISKEGLKNSSAVLHPSGTVIISRDAGIGKSAVLYSKMAVSQHFIAWQCDKSKLLNWFFYYILQILKPKLENVAMGSTIKTIGLPYFKELCILIPRSTEQQKITNCLSSIDELITIQAKKIESLKAHKKGLMQQLFPATDGDCMDAGGRATQDAKAEENG